MKKLKLNLNFKKTIYSRILLFNIALIVFMTLVFQIVYYNYFNILYSKTFNEMNMQNVHQVQKSIDDLVIFKAIDIINVYFSDISTNGDFFYPIDHDVLQDPLSISKVKNRLEDIKNTNGIVDSIDVYYKKSGVIFVDGAVHFLNDGTLSRGKYPQWFEKYEASEANTIWLPRTAVTYPEKKNVVTFVRSVPFFVTPENIQTVVAINIDENAFLNYMGNINDNFFIIDSEGNYIASNKNFKISKKDSDILDKILSSDDEGFFVSNVDGKRSVVSFVESKYNNWRYVSIMPLDMFYKKSIQIRNVLITIGILLLFVYMGVSVLLTKRAHKPLANILKDVNYISKTMDGDTSIHNEYNVLSHTINNLVFKVNDLTQKVESSKSIVHDNIIRKLLTGAINNTQSTYYETCEDINLKQEKFFCFILKIFYNSNISPENKKLISYNINKLLENSNNNWDIRAISDDSSNTIAGIANFDSEADIEEIKNFLILSIETILNVKYVICLGNCYDIKTGSINKSYSEAKKCLEYAFLRYRDNIIYFNSQTESTLKTCGYGKIISKIEAYIRSCEEAKLTSTIDGVIEAFETGEYEIDYCKSTLFDIVYTIRKTINEIGYNDAEVFGCDIIEVYNNIDNINSFKMWINSIVEVVIKYINEKKSNIDKSIEIKIKKIIEDNIYRDISLDYVANQLNIRPDSLSKIFKTLTNLNFTDYVRDLKLNCAVKLLEENKLSVQEISSKIGYNSTHYFIRIFKEKYGCTPKQYQRINTFSKEE